MTTDGINFTPTGTPGIAPPGADGISFTPAGDAPATQTQPSQGSGLGNFALHAAQGAVNMIDNNPISRGLISLAALPTQGLAKAFGKPDPFADNAMGKGSIVNPGGIGVTSSDQPLGKFAQEEVGNAATVGSLLLPAARVAGAAAPYLVPTLGRFAAPLARIGTNAAVGGLQGLAAGMQQGQNVDQLKQSAGTGTILGGSLATAGEFGSALLNSLAGTTGASKLQSHVQSGSSAKTLTRAFSDTSTPTTNPIKTMEENGLIKDLKVIDSTVNVDNLTNHHQTGSLDNLIQDQQDMGTAAVGQMPGGVPTAQFKKNVLDFIKSNPQLKASGTVGKMTAEIGRRFDDYLESYGAMIPYKDIDRIRIQMNKVYNAETWDAEKAIGNSARSLLYNGPSAGPALRSAMQNEQELIHAKEFLAKLAGTKVKGGRLGKYIADLGGGIVGSVIAAPGGPIAQGIAAPAAAALTNKAVGTIQSNYFKPLLGNGARSLQSFLPAASTAKTVGQSMLIPSAVQQ